MNKLIAAGCICFATICLILPAGCGDPCGNEVVSETKSPDTKLRVVVFARDCGALTDFSTQISILSSSAFSPSGRGNVFIAGDENHAVPLGAKGAMEIKVKWDSNSSLLVSYAQKAEVFLKKPSIAGVTIRYEALP